MTDQRGRILGVGLKKYGGPEVLETVLLGPEPLGPQDVRIAVKAAAVNPTDAVLRVGTRAVADTPVGEADVPGMDAAGVIVEVGDRVTTVALGDRVAAFVLPAGEHGAYRSEVVVPASSVVRAPRDTTHAEAATLLLNALTAKVALDVLDLEAGQTVAVTGAAGAVGGYVVQMAKDAGLIVVADASTSDRALVGELGADELVARGPGFADAVRAVRPDGVDGLVDAANQTVEVLEAVKDGGAVATLRGYAGDGSDRITVEPVQIAPFVQQHDVLDGLRELAEKGVLTLRVANTLPADQAVEAHRRLDEGGLRGRLVLTFE